MLTAQVSLQQHRRLDWVDVARGIGIILVIYGHALRAIVPPPGALPAWAAAQDGVIYAFHMPLFFFLVGLFIWPSLGRGRMAFLKDRALTVLYPYLLWSVAVGVLEMLARPFVNSPVELRDILAIGWQPIEQFWFLYALFVLQLVAFLLFPRRMLFILAGLVLPIAAAMIASPLFVARAFSWLPFVVLGMLLAPLLSTLATRDAGLQLASASLAWLLFAVLVARRAELNPTFFLYAAGLAGTLATIASAMLLRRPSRLAALLVWLGGASMAIFSTLR